MSDGPAVSPESNILLDPRLGAIKTFLTTFFTTPMEDRPSYGFDFDISAPRSRDMQKLGTDGFEITHFSTTPRDQAPDKSSYHFYVGETEFHMTGKVAEEVDKILEANSALKK